MGVFLFSVLLVSLISSSRQQELYADPQTNTVGIRHQKTLAESGDAIVKGFGSLSHVAVPGGPTSLSGGVGVQHLSTGNTLGVEITKSNRGLGTDVNVLGKANLYENNNAKLDSQAYFSKNSRSGFETVGTDMKLSHLPSGSGLDIGVSHTNRGVGTNLNVGYSVNVLKSDNPKLEVGAHFSKNLNSDSKPNFGARASLKWEF